MFDFFKKKKETKLEIAVSEEEDQDVKIKENGVKTATGFSATEAARVSTEQAAKYFAKPDTYTGNRKLYDSGKAKYNAKKTAFAGGAEVRDPYTGERLVMTKAEARQQYGDNWQSHLAESDHIKPLERLAKENQNNPWVSVDNVKDAGNSSSNIEQVSRKFNNAKRSRTNKEFVDDDEYLARKGIHLSESEKKAAVERGEQAERAINRQLKKEAVKNITKTGHKAGIDGAKNAGVTAVTMSGIMNMVAVIKGEKEVEEAVADTVRDGGQAAVTGYVMSGGLTVVSHSLSGSSSKFLQALSKSNVPGKVITAVTLTANTLKRYGDGDITTEECLIELGGSGLTFATAGYSMAIGQALIPIPIVGGAIGALVGSTLTSSYYNQLICRLQEKKLEHEERLRIIAECEQVAEQRRKFRMELEKYLSDYFKDYRDCFDEALSEMQLAFEIGDVDGVVAGANQITRKLGGTVKYENMSEFRAFLASDEADVF